MKNSFLIILIISILVISCKSQTSKEKTETKKTDSSVIELKTVEPIEPQETAKYESVKMIPVPVGYKRIEIETGTFGEYLQSLELKTENNKVYLHTGELKWNQTAQFAVIRIDVGTRDLQQCAEAVMR